MSGGLDFFRCTDLLILLLLTVGIRLEAIARPSVSASPVAASAMAPFDATSFPRPFRPG